MAHTGHELARDIRDTLGKLKDACARLDEATARSAPAGRWSPREILSHLAGPEGVGFIPLLRRFLNEDTPTIDLAAENTFLAGKRSSMTFSQTLKAVEKEYESLARFAEGLSEEDLVRKAHVPLFKDSPLGEYPTLAQMLHGLGQYHVAYHIDHLAEILGELRTKAH